MNIEERFDKIFEIPEICPDFLKPHLVELFNNIEAFIKKEQEDLVREMVCVEENMEGVISRYVIERKYADEQEGELGYRRIIAKSKGIII